MSSGASPDDAPPVHGFVRTTWRLRSQIISWDLLVAAGLTCVGVLFASCSTLESVLSDLLVAEFGLIGAVLGVVIAGLAIVVAFLSRQYARILVRSEEGPIGDLWPFWFVAALSASAVLAAGAGLVLIAQEPSLRRAVFGVTTFLSSYAVLATVNLVAFVAQQGVTRAWQLSKPGSETNDSGESASSRLDA
jgi:hypothetical protein